MLSRLIGIEILPAVALVAKLNIALKLGEIECKIKPVPPVSVIIGDALCPTTQSKIQNLKSKIPIFVGNPPFSSLSTTTNAWITRLVRGDEEVRGYAAPVKLHPECVDLGKLLTEAWQELTTSN